jgi:hypothetical protein
VADDDDDVLDAVAQLPADKSANWAGPVKLASQ